MASNIQVFVKFKEQAVFAGEEVQCIITFKNVASSPGLGLGPDWKSRQQDAGGIVGATLQAAGTSRKTMNPRLAAITRSHGRTDVEFRHRVTTLLGISPSPKSGPLSPAWTSAGALPARPSQKHQRSVSIISIGSPNPDNVLSQNAQVASPRQPTTSGHHRSASFQVLSGRVDGSIEVPLAASHSSNFVPKRRPSSGKAVTPAADLWIPFDPNPRTLSVECPSPPRSGAHRATQSSTTSAATISSPSISDVTRATNTPPGEGYQDGSQAATKPHDPMVKLSQMNKTLLGTSVAGSNRSSDDFQTLSNHSQETMASEQVPFVRDLQTPTFPSTRFRQHYRMDSFSPKHKRPGPEKMLMGYAQINADFTLDGSLIDQSQFEDVKRKGFLGGQGGGGVVGIKTSQPSRGFLGSFNLNNIGQSIGDLLGGSDLSSIKEMKDVTSARAIPLLSNPQSLLFVDLQLSPEEEKTFSFRYTLPQGLPSSHKGKAIKVVYHLVLGVQVAPDEKDVQPVRRVSVPFRVFSGVASDGEIYGHDLMQPHVVLQDLARISPIDDLSPGQGETTTPKPVDTESSTRHFLTYVDTLLDRSRRRQSSSGTIEASYLLPSTNQEQGAKYAIGQAIMFSNQTRSSTDRSSNRFEIARNSLHVAIIVLNRSLHRLGETITATIDFSGAQMPTFSVRSSLETTEKVNSGIALRSAASINRVSRRLYASCSENTLYARRVVFNPSIPPSATPTFVTSGVSLDWGLRFEFATIKASAPQEVRRTDALEEIIKDERGIVIGAAETVDCDMFEVNIPITVYGDIMLDGTENEEVAGTPI